MEEDVNIMNVIVLGWYGTETMGDRAILDGVFKILRKAFTLTNVYIGSLFPFFTERTMTEDSKIYFESENICISIFDQKNVCELENHIRRSDFVIMGGGPVMDINDIYMIKRAFKIAKILGKITAMVGCGYGPFHSRRLHHVAKQILVLSDLCIFRDELSKKRAANDVDDVQMYHLVDPAILSALEFKKEATYRRKSTIAVNYRYQYQDPLNQRERLLALISTLADQFDKVTLVPMHSFFYCLDDRSFFSELLDERKKGNVQIQFVPQNLYELYDTFSQSFGCIGMRYHSVVLQTILNGNNIILDYTEPNMGKTSGFLDELGYPEFYRDRYISLSRDSIDVDKCVRQLKDGQRFNYTLDDKVMEQYVCLLRKMI